MKRSTATRGQTAANKKNEDEKPKDPFHFGAGSSTDDDFEMSDKRTTRHGGRPPQDRTSTPVPTTSRGRGQAKGKKAHKLQKGGLDEEQIDQKLKDAGLYEKQMSLKQKMEYMDVLNASLQNYDERQEVEKALSDSISAKTEDKIPKDQGKETQTKNSDQEPDILEVDFIASPQKSISTNMNSANDEDTQNSQLRAKRPRSRATKKAVVKEADVDVLIESDDEVIPTSKTQEKDRKHEKSTKHSGGTSDQEHTSEKSTDDDKKIPKVGSDKNSTRTSRKKDVRQKGSPERKEIVTDIPELGGVGLNKRRSLHRKTLKTISKEKIVTSRETRETFEKKQSDDERDNVIEEIEELEPKKRNNVGSKGKSTRNDGTAKKMPQFNFTSESENDQSFSKGQMDQKSTAIKGQWNRGRPSRVGDDRDLNSSYEDDETPSKAKAVAVQVHHDHKSFEEPILDEDDLFDNQQKSIARKQARDNDIKSNRESVEVVLDIGALGNKERAATSKPNKLTVRDILVDESDEEDEDVEEITDHKPTASGLNLDHSSESEGEESIGSPVLGRDSQIKRDTSLTIPDTQADWSFNAGDVSRVPDTQQPVGHDDETVDPGAPGIYDDEESTVLETPTNKKPEVESQPLFSPSPIPKVSPKVKRGSTNRDDLEKEKDRIAMKLDVVATSDLEETQDMPAEEEEVLQDEVEGKDVQISSPVYKIQKSDERDEVDVMEADAPPAVTRSGTGSFEPVISGNATNPGETEESASDKIEDEDEPPRNRKRAASEERSTEEPPAKKTSAFPSVDDVFDGKGEAPSPTHRISDSPPPRPLVNKRRLQKKWYEKRPYFCPSGKDPNTYTGTIVAYFDQYRVLLREQQRNVIEKVEWGAPIVVGPHAKAEPKYRLRGHDKQEPQEGLSGSTGSSGETQDSSYEPKTSEKTNDYEYYEQRSLRTRQRHRELFSNNELDKEVVKSKDDDEYKPSKEKGAVTSGKGKGTRLRRGRNLGHRRIGEKSAQQSITDHFGFTTDTEATQAYNFDDEADDFMDFEFPKGKTNNSSHKQGLSATSTVTSNSAHNVDNQLIDVDEDSHEAVDLLSDLGQRSRSVTPVEKSRSVTPDSQESKKSKSSSSTSGPSRPVSSTSGVSSRSANTPFPYVELGGGNTMADEDTTIDTVYSEIYNRTNKSETKSKCPNGKKDVNSNRFVKHAQKDNESDRMSPVSDISEQSVKDKKNEMKHSFGESVVEPESQPMETIDSMSLGPSSEQDVFASSSQWLEDEKRARIPMRTYGAKTNVAKKAYTWDSASDEEIRPNLPFGQRIDFDRINKAKKRSKEDEDSELETVLKLSKEEFTKTAKDMPEEQLSEDEELVAALNLSRRAVAKTAIDKPKEQLSKEERLTLKEFVTEDSDSDAKGDSEAEKVLKDETGADELRQVEADEFEIAPKVRVKKRQPRREVGNESLGNGYKEAEMTKTTRLGRKKNFTVNEEINKNDTNRKGGQCPCCSEFFEDIDALQNHAADCLGPSEVEEPRPGPSKIHSIRRRNKIREEKLNRPFNRNNIEDAIKKAMEADSIDSDAAVSSSDDYDPTKDKDKGSTEDEYEDAVEEKENLPKGRGHGRGKGRGKNSASAGEGRPKRRHSPDPATPRQRKAPRVDLDAPISQATTPTDRRRIRAESRAQTQAQEVVDEQLDDIVIGKMIPCFMCNKEFHEDVLERHVNECLDSGAQDEPLQQQQPVESRQTRNRHGNNGAAKHANAERQGGRGKKRTKQT